MANILINDLLDSSELDKKAMAVLLGGCGGTIAPWARAHGRPFKDSLRRPARGGSPFGGGVSPGGGVESFLGQLLGSGAPGRISFAQDTSLTLTLSFNTRTRFNAEFA